MLPVDGHARKWGTFDPQWESTLPQDVKCHNFQVHMMSNGNSLEASWVEQVSLWVGERHCITAQLAGGRRLQLSNQHMRSALLERNHMHIPSPIQHLPPAPAAHHSEPLLPPHASTPNHWQAKEAKKRRLDQELPGAQERAK
jgi:hypothetical protein